LLKPLGFQGLEAQGKNTQLQNRARKEGKRICTDVG